MDDSGNNVISTIPKQFSDKYVWRDHWMQAIYFLPKTVPVRKGDEIDVVCSHDEYSLWFKVPDEKERKGGVICTCQLHSTLSRYDFYRMNRTDENKEFIDLIQKVIFNQFFRLWLFFTVVFRSVKIRWYSHLLMGR